MYKSDHDIWLEYLIIIDQIDQQGDVFVDLLDLNVKRNELYAELYNRYNDFYSGKINKDRFNEIISKEGLKKYFGFKTPLSKTDSVKNYINNIEYYMVVGICKYYIINHIDVLNSYEKCYY